MNLKEKILEDIKDAMRQKDDFKRNTLRTLNACFKQIEVDERIELDNERIYKIIASEIKKRNEAALAFNKGSREDLAQKELLEVEILSQYLPKQLSDEELENELKKLITTLKISSLKEQGILMKEAKNIFKSSVDGKRLNEKVRKLLS
ncbi:GatB/YqeY domain-containing protein [Campylobacter insulaenigrae]|uniref:GatB/YqeY domain-containing protein n=1 Tax=Campylobacter insulaenigrae TaxID=260714 RepID=UPI0021524052|nr:GatB/YqeY domain-containing protein [Campylobacter insulaenigrae]MCR6570353.1 GatB/YqeY domain-containing protein [Campylobacter insulaenigrae]MCR6573392.1 GatB/YqeY domain-containing protein [Campylobacter insulaenigrae]MCR6574857.1 GatB/YqeY domain-containing protein [Campylobacter insulaenigrae]MCR6576451.1 GatB/YqeY domain-containing protein [Campylobacter insulaenigrae]MCR6577917.1 GatB/YqeY domain-containing protein [Campylobacter insulaenigrae]